MIFYISQRTDIILMETLNGILRVDDFFKDKAPRKIFDFLTAID